MAHTDMDTPFAKSIYSLRDDREAIEQMQLASASEGNIGLKSTHGLVGSEAWWSKVGTAELPLHIVRGVVTKFWPGHHGDFAEFEIRDPAGSHSTWPCGCPASLARFRFVVGATVEISYVVQQFKVTLGNRATTNLVTQIREA